MRATSVAEPRLQAVEGVGHGGPQVDGELAQPGDHVAPAGRDADLPDRRAQVLRGAASPRAARPRPARRPRARRGASRAASSPRGWSRRAAARAGRARRRSTRRRRAARRASAAPAPARCAARRSARRRRRGRASPMRAGSRPWAAIASATRDAVRVARLAAPRVTSTPQNARLPNSAVPKRVPSSSMNAPTQIGRAGSKPSVAQDPDRPRRPRARRARRRTRRRWGPCPGARRS